MHVWRLASLLITAAVLLDARPLEAAELKLLDGPLWVFPGQTFRIAVEQPALPSVGHGDVPPRHREDMEMPSRMAGRGELEVEVPPAVEMFDTWPKDAVQRFYFRALKPGDATLTFHGKGGSLEVRLEVVPWSDIFKPRKFKNLDLPRVWPLP